MNFIKKTLALGAVLMSFMAVGSQAMAKEYTVKMVTNLEADQVYYFEPAEITIQPGDTIKWVNVQEDMHNAVADAVPKGAEFFESPMLEEEGASWSYTFNTAGTYSYHCHPHAAAGMKGIITVGAPSAPEEMQGGAHNHDHGAHGHGSHGDDSASNTKSAMGTGVIHSVSRLNRKVNLTHDPIPALKWPEMTMDLDVAEGVDLKALAPEEKVKFRIELGDDKVYRITKIMKSDGQHDPKQCKPGMDCPMHEGMKHGGDNEDGHGGHDH